MWTARAVGKKRRDWSAPDISPRVTSVFVGLASGRA